MQKNPNKRKCFDAAELDSELSFNHFGSVRRENNERDDFHYDFNFIEKLPVFDAEEDASFVYDRD